MSVKALISEVSRVAPGFAQGNRIVETLQRLIRGEELNSLEKANLMNLAAVSEFTAGEEDGQQVFYDAKGTRISGPLAECLRWASANKFKFINSHDFGEVRLGNLGIVFDALLKMDLTEAVAEDLVEPLVMAFDSRNIGYLSEALAEKLLEGDWGLWTSLGKTYVKMRTGDRPPEIIEWCLERALLRRAMPYANW